MIGSEAAVYAPSNTSRAVNGGAGSYSYGRARNNTRSRRSRAAPYVERRPSFLKKARDSIASLASYFGVSLSSESNEAIAEQRQEVDAGVDNVPEFEACTSEPKPPRDVSDEPSLPREMKPIGALPRDTTGERSRVKELDEGVEVARKERDVIPTATKTPYSGMKWRGKAVEDLTFGELRECCQEFKLSVSANRFEMQTRAIAFLETEAKLKQAKSQDGRLKRQMSTEDLDSVMQKKARIGFSRSEYERYLQLMRDNLVGFEETPQAARSDAPLRSKPPMIKKYRSSDYLPPVSGISEGRRPRGVSTSPWIKKPELPHSSSRSRLGAGFGGSQNVNLSFRPQTASTRIPEPRTSSDAAQRIMSSISSLSSPLISSSSMRSQHRPSRRKPFLPVVNPKPTDKAPFRKPVQLDTTDTAKSLPAVAAPSPMAKTPTVPLFTQISPTVAATPVSSKAPLQQSRTPSATIKLPDFPESGAEEISLGTLPVPLKASGSTAVDFGASKSTLKESLGVQGKAKRARSSAYGESDKEKDTKQPAVPLSFDFKSTPVADDAAVVAFTPSKPEEGSEKETPVESSGFKFGSSSASALSTTFQFGTTGTAEVKVPEDEECKVCGMGMDDVDHSSCQKEKETPKEKTSFAAPPVSLFSTPAQPAPVPESADADCSVCGMGMEDVDHSECKKDEAADAKPAATSGFKFPASLLNAAPAGGPTFSFGTPATSSSAEAAPSISIGSAVPFKPSLPPSTSTLSFGNHNPTPEKKESTQSSAPTFSFGAAASSSAKSSIDIFTPSSTSDLKEDKSASDAPSFNFGASTAQAGSVTATSTDADKPAVKNPLFSFGDNKKDDTPSNKPTFALPSVPADRPKDATSVFNANKPDSSGSSSAGFSFGSAASSSASSSGFSFGTTPQTSAAPSAAQAFPFSDTPASTPSAGSSMFGSAASSVPSSSPSFSFPSSAGAKQATGFGIQSFGAGSGDAMDSSMSPAPSPMAGPTSGFGNYPVQSNSTPAAPPASFSFNGFGAASTPAASSAPGFSFSNSPATTSATTAPAQFNGFSNSTANSMAPANMGMGSSFGSAGSSSVGMAAPSGFGSLPDAAPTPGGFNFSAGGGFSNGAAPAPAPTGQRRVIVKAKRRVRK